jgi:hypothetical protein
LVKKQQTCTVFLVRTAFTASRMSENFHGFPNHSVRLFLLKIFWSSIDTASIIYYFIWVLLSFWAFNEAKMVTDSSMFGLLWRASTGGCVKSTKKLFYQKDTKINVTNATKLFNSLHLNTETPEAKHQACTIVTHVVFHGGWPLQPQDIILIYPNLNIIYS